MYTPSLRVPLFNYYIVFSIHYLSFFFFFLVFFFFVFFFFFSSRRRHTRLTCDWSSDVCSSDLTCFRIMRESDSESLFSLMPDVPRSTPDERLSRIAQAHKKDVDEHGEIGRASCRERV